jgi:molybdate transport system ATP-binding protein
MTAAFRLKIQHSFSGAPRGSGLDLDVSLPGIGTTGIFGPSGAGKTTLLRVLAGLLVADQAEIHYQGETWQSGKVVKPAHARGIGYVFQEPSLFPHHTVAGNIDYARKRSKSPAASQLDLNNVLHVLDIESLMNRRVQSLSGGEQQRVALARALASGPRLLLLDEPLSALDAVRKREILPFLARVKAEFDLPMLYVSHAADELAMLADHLLVLDRGKVHANGAMAETYPALGELGDVHLGVLMEGVVSEVHKNWQLARFSFAGGKLWLRDSGTGVGQALRVRVQARDVSLSLTEDSESSILNRLPATVLAIEPGTDPAMCVVRLILGSANQTSQLLAQITAKSAADLGLTPGMELFAQIKSVAILG